MWVGGFESAFYGEKLWSSVRLVNGEFRRRADYETLLSCVLR